MLTPALPDSWTPVRAAHLLNRAGFGGNPENYRAVSRKSMAEAVKSLLDGNGDDGSRFPVPEWATPEGHRKIRRKLYAGGQAMDDAADEKMRQQKRRMIQREVRITRREQTGELTDWWFRRMRSGSHPLREKMTLFWHGHFATSLEKVKTPVLMLRQNQMFRRYALGNFGALTKRVCLDPAMMIYLDTNRNKRTRPNENFARELLELFTLGEGHYTEKDVKAAARAFTGYQLDRRRPFSNPRFASRHHDTGKKTVLGRTGPFGGDDVVDIILGQKQCARFIVTKLWEYFVYEDPAPEIVETLATELSQAKYEIRPVLKTIFSSREFYSKRALRSQIKSPVHLVVQMSHQLEMENMPLALVMGGMHALGQVVFRPPNVAGWEGGKSWINTNTLLHRYNFAGFVVKGKGNRNLMRTVQASGGMRYMDSKRRRELLRHKGPDLRKLAPADLRKNPDKLVEELVFRFFQDPAIARERTEFARYAARRQNAGFTDAEIGNLIHLMMSTPYYQLT